MVEKINIYVIKCENYGQKMFKAHGDAFLEDKYLSYVIINMKFVRIRE